MTQRDKDLVVTRTGYSIEVLVQGDEGDAERWENVPVNMIPGDQGVPAGRFIEEELVAQIMGLFSYNSAVAIVAMAKARDPVAATQLYRIVPWSVSVRVDANQFGEPALFPDSLFTSLPRRPGGVRGE